MAVRSTGIGWASGVGRSGAILAPIVIGTLVGMALPLEQNFMAIAIPAVIATVAVLLIDHKRSASAQRALAEVKAADASFGSIDRVATSK
jgi:AAHS family benzoate transporter-like MFS transporter